MPTKLANVDKVTLKDKYVGETKNQLRHGYGVYKYENKFFRYEGQWVEGLKHGHGKLTMGDGGYYEGRFEQGEIQGHGYRVFGLSGTTYSGQFHRGQIHGQGLLRKTSGEQYEGSWVFGQMEGEGIYTDEQGGVYEGGFHDNKRHGEGRQIYSNGDQYEGDWVLGRRHGHGLQRCADGTIYDGQWRGDVYHGEGSISHVSGVSYKGLWLNGRPACEAVGLVTEGESLSVEQGKPFSLSIQCVDDRGEVVTIENGRSFKVTAGVKKSLDLSPRLSKSKSKITVLSSPTKQKSIIGTPFGYPALPYSILQVPSSKTALTEEVSLDTGSKTKMVSFKESEQDLLDRQVSTQGKVPTTSSQLITRTSELSAVSSADIASTSTSKSPSVKERQPRGGSLTQQDTRSLLMGKTLDSIDSEDSKVQKKDEEFLESLVAPYPVQTTAGQAVFRDLYIPPPPLPDISHIVRPSDSDMSVESKERPGSRLETPSPSPHQVSPRASPRRGSRTSSSMKLRKSTEKLKAEKDKLLNPKREKYALTGTYVLIVTEDTEPPFLGSRLPDLFVQVQVVPQKTSREKSMEKLLRSKSRLRVASRLAESVSSKS